MSNKTCQANNKATCRVHGVFNATAVVLNPTLAATNLSQSKKACDLASTLEELSEAKQLLHHDQKAYDATSKGREELVIAQFRSESFAEELEIRRRFDESVEYRKNLMENNPVLKPGYDAYNNFVQENAVKSFTFDSTDAPYNEAYSTLREVSYGTPIAMKTFSGSIIYDAAGDGLVPEVNHESFLSKMTKGGFVRAVSASPKHSSVSLKNSSVGFSLANVAEIHILKEGAFSKGIPNTLKTEGAEVNSNASKKKPSVWAVSGNDYYYQIQGSSNSEFKNTRKSEPSDLWEEHPTMVIAPYKPKKIEQIDTLS